MISRARLFLPRVRDPVRGQQAPSLRQVILGVLAFLFMMAAFLYLIAAAGA